MAAGAVVLGFFQPMSTANEANALVQKYGEVLEEPLTAEINGHTVSVRIFGPSLVMVMVCSI